MNNMKDNPYWSMANSGCEVPLEFNEKQWRAAVAECVRRAEINRKQFIKNSDINTYNNMCANFECFDSLSMYLTAFVQVVGGTTEKKWNACRNYVAEETSKEASKVLPEVRKFLKHMILSGSSAEKQWAEREFSVVYQAFKPAGSVVGNLEAELSKKEKDNAAVYFKKWPATAPDGEFKVDCTSDNGWFFVMPTDNIKAPVILSSHRNEEVRRALWEEMQKSFTSDEYMQKFIDARNQGAKSVGLENYREVANGLQASLRGSTAGNIMIKAIKPYTDLVKKLDDKVINKGIKKAEKTVSDNSSPWNIEHFKWEGAVNGRNIDVGIMPMRRVINKVIPDLLAMGGWSVVGEPERSGRGARTIYKYRITDGQRPALLYFSGRRRLFLRPGDSYMGECAAIRTRRQINGRKAVTPVISINLDMELNCNCIDEIEKIQYIAHEVGHAIHFLELPGTSSFEVTRMPIGLGEIPSLMMEEVVKDSKLLMGWANPRGPKKGKTSRYWETVIKDVERNESLSILMDRVEKSCFDSFSLGHDASELKKIRNKIRRNLDMPELHENDRGYAAIFDCTDAHCGNDYCYIVGEAISKTLIKVDGKQKAVRRLFDILHCSADVDFNKTWAKTYGIGLTGTFKVGIKNLINEKVKLAKKTIK